MTDSCKESHWMATPVVKSAGITPFHTREPMGASYFWLLAFVAVYLMRPEDWIPGIHILPLAKITGLLALLAFLISGGLSPRFLKRLPREMLYLILLLAQLCLATPFAIWRGGAFHVVAGIFSKTVLIALLITLTVTTLPRLRRLLFLQAASAPLVSAIAILAGNTVASRLKGVGSAFDNPNDFALLIVLALPFCFAFFLRTRSFVIKAAWAVGIAIMGYALVLTGSRGGLLAVVLSMGVCLWEFGLKGRRPHLLFLAGLATLAILLFAGTGSLRRRFEATFKPGRADDPTYASTQLREETLKVSLMTTLKHPLFGVGPGNFQIISGSWHETHNTYTQLSSEAGVPALILFLLILGHAFRRVRSVKRLAAGERDSSRSSPLLQEGGCPPGGARPEVRLLAGATRASLVGLAVGALFTSAGYQLFTYILVAYAGALYNVASLEPGVRSLESEDNSQKS